jgi:hypothetical protein
MKEKPARIQLANFIAKFNLDIAELARGPLRGDEPGCRQR